MVVDFQRVYIYIYKYVYVKYTVSIYKNIVRMVVGDEDETLHFFGRKFQSPQNKRRKRPHENAHHLLFHHFLLRFRDDFFFFFRNVRMTMFIGHEKLIL